MNDLGMYYIRDDVGDVPTTQIILSVNRKTALLGFNNYIESEIKPKHLNPSNYSMYLIGICSGDDYSIKNSESKLVCKGNEVRATLIDLNVLTDDIEEVTDQPEAIVLENGEING